MGKLTRGGKPTWKAAFLASPGPSTWPAAAWLALKGMAMGSADIIPGVSGGTIALITGIYGALLRAIKSADAQALACLLRLDFKDALARMHIRFLMALFGGIGLAIISLARLLNYLLHHHPLQTWGFFFGLIAASVWVVAKKVNSWNMAAALAGLAGAVAAWMIVNLIPMQTPDSAAFIFFSGLIAICAMILPGISGAFILLILGKYEFITATLKNPFLPHNMIIIAIFCAGCICGLAGFSRALAWLLDRHHGITLAFLTGLMAGSMKKIWPWKQAIETKLIDGQVDIVWGGPAWPAAIDGQVAAIAALALTGMAAVLLLDHVSARYGRSH
jgi:putative membrane protein